MFIDTHAHIYLEDFKTDLEGMIQRAIDAGVEKILLPNIDVSTIDDMLELEEKYAGYCFAMMGLHPCSVKEDFEIQLNQIESWLSKRNFLAVGEIGTDLYWDKSYWSQQQEAFRIQCELAINHNLPIAVHCRDSIDETILLVEDYCSRGLRGVFHCFTGSMEQGKKITDLGLYLGIGGVSTFKNGGLDSVIPALDPNKIILETDSPYLAPAPDRGKRNEPSKVKIIASKVAEYLEISEEEVGLITTKNANALFFPS